MPILSGVVTHSYRSHKDPLLASFAKGLLFITVSWRYVFVRPIHADNSFFDDGSPDNCLTNAMTYQTRSTWRAPQGKNGILPAFRMDKLIPSCMGSSERNTPLSCQ